MKNWEKIERGENIHIEMYSSGNDPDIWLCLQSTIFACL